MGCGIENMWVRPVFMWVKPVFLWATKICEVVINKYKAVPRGQQLHSKANCGIFRFSTFFTCLTRDFSALIAFSENNRTR